MSARIKHFLFEVAIPNIVFSFAAFYLGKLMGVRADYMISISTLVFGGSSLTFYFIDAFRYKTMNDHLTGLKNREFIYRRLRALVKKKSSFYFMLLDLNRFKNVNDTLGHSIGDKLLVEAANRLSSCLRGKDVIARLGGDEFGIIVCSDSFDYDSFAKRITSAMQKQFQIDKFEMNIGVSIGIAKFGEHGTTVESIVQHADMAMYHAKREKLGHFLYSDDLQEINFESLFLANDLRTAVEQRSMFNEYQPKFNIATKKITGVECLCRWEHPSYGKVPADRFIPLAEQEGLIDDILFIVLENALRDWHLINKSGFDLEMSVNISAENLTNPKVISRIVSTISKFGIPPEKLTLEITETAIAKNLENTIKSLILLNSFGIKLSVDDFGTGYSSYFYLKHLPISELKIDKSFVDDVIDNVQDYMIVNSIIQLAHSAKCSVVAEGVENAEQFDLLSSIACDYAQGNHLSGSLPVDSLIEFCSKSTT